MAYFKKINNTNKTLCLQTIALVVLFAFKLSFNAFPFLDDYIQFKGYSLYDNPIKDTYVSMGLYSVRPLAGLFDILFYSKFYNNLYIPYFVITVLHFTAILLMHYNFKKIGINFGWIFIILCLFNPVLIESTYWLSASSRIIPPLFLSQLAVYLIFCRKAKYKPLYLFAYFILSLASMGFYEQMSLFSFIINLFFCIKLKKNPELIICIINALLFVVYYFLFKNNGIFNDRGSLGGFNFVLLINDIKTALGTGLKCIIKSPNSGFPAFKTFLVALLCLLCIRTEKDRFCPLKFFVGICVFIICFVPFLLLKNYFITFRSIFLAFIGIAMILDFLGDIWRLKYPFTVLICVFMVFGWSNEIKDYKKVYEADRKIIEGISNNLSQAQKQADDFTLGILGAKKCYVPLKVLYGEHILNVTSSDWALTGALRAEFENVKFKYVIMTDDKLNDVCDVVLDVSNVNSIKKIK